MMVVFVIDKPFQTENKRTKGSVVDSVILWRCVLSLMPCGYTRVVKNSCQMGESSLESKTCFCCCLLSMNRAATHPFAARKKGEKLA